MYIPTSYYRRRMAKEASRDDSPESLMLPTALLDGGLVSASLVAYGIWDLIDGTGRHWMDVCAIVVGGTLACALWSWARKVLADEERGPGPAAHTDALRVTRRKALSTHSSAR